jgi:hypothetical protein
MAEGTLPALLAGFRNDCENLVDFFVRDADQKRRVPRLDKSARRGKLGGAKAPLYQRMFKAPLSSLFTTVRSIFMMRPSSLFADNRERVD